MIANFIDYTLQKKCFSRYFNASYIFPVRRIWYSLLFILASIFYQLYQESVSVKCNVASITCVSLVYTALNIKLGLIKQFVTASDQNGEVSVGIQAMLPKLSDAKFGTGVFVGWQVKQMLAWKLIDKDLGMHSRKMSIGFSP